MSTRIQLHLTANPFLVAHPAILADPLPGKAQIHRNWDKLAPAHGQHRGQPSGSLPLRSRKAWDIDAAFEGTAASQGEAVSTRDSHPHGPDQHASALHDRHHDEPLRATSLHTPRFTLLKPWGALPSLQTRAAPASMDVAPSGEGRTARWWIPAITPHAAPAAQPVDTHSSAQPMDDAAARRLRICRVLESGHRPEHAGRMVISGRMADVCAELDRLATLDTPVAKRAAHHEASLDRLADVRVELDQLATGHPPPDRMADVSAELDHLAGTCTRPALQGDPHSGFSRLSTPR